MDYLKVLFWQEAEFFLFSARPLSVHILWHIFALLSIRSFDILYVTPVVSLSLSAWL